MSGPLRIGVSGIGWCGSEHVKAFQAIPGCAVMWLQGRNADRVRANLARYGVTQGAARITERFADLVEDPTLDIISIAGVNSTHTPYAVAAAQAGKHVMLEKPIARDATELAALVAAVAQAKVKTVVSFELYWNPLVQVMRWLVASGRLGRVMFVRSNYHSRVGAWYSGWDWCRRADEARSFLINAGCHSVDAVRQFAGAPATAVSAFTTSGLEQGYEYPTTIQANIQFANGVLGQVSASADVASPYHFGLEIYGTRLSVVNDRLRWPAGAELDAAELAAACPVPGVRFAREAYSATAEQIRIDCIQPNSVSVDHHPFADEARALVAAVRDGGETPLAVATAAETHRICFAADASATAGGRVIQLETE